MLPILWLLLQFWKVRRGAERKVPRFFEFPSRILLRAFPESFEDFLCFLGNGDPAIFQFNIPGKLKENIRKSLLESRQGNFMWCYCWFVPCFIAIVWVCCDIPLQKAPTFKKRGAKVNHLPGEINVDSYRSKSEKYRAKGLLMVVFKRWLEFVRRAKFPCPLSTSIWPPFYLSFTSFESLFCLFLTSF